MDFRHYPFSRQIQMAELSYPLRAYKAHEIRKDAPSKGFVADAFAHCKFVGYSTEVEPLLVKAGIADDLDAGCFILTKDGMGDFVDALGELRFWNRELNVDVHAPGNEEAS